MINIKTHIIIKNFRKPFLPLAKIRNDFNDHRKLIDRMRKMDKENKVLIKGLENIPNNVRQKLPHLNEVGMIRSKSLSENKGRMISSSIDRRSENKKQDFVKKSYFIKY
jgi:hypothetical protein